MRLPVDCTKKQPPGSATAILPTINAPSPGKGIKAKAVYWLAYEIPENTTASVVHDVLAPK